MIILDDLPVESTHLRMELDGADWTDAEVAQLHQEQAQTKKCVCWDVQRLMLRGLHPYSG